MEIMENFSCLEQNLKILLEQMSDLKHMKYQVATKEERNMDGWLENVEGREREFDEISKEFGILSKSDDVINLEALKTLSQKVIENLDAVNVLKDKGNANLESSPVHSNKMIHKTFSHEDLIKFTSKFTKNVGSGAFSNVYKGQLDDDKLVAVKVLRDTVAIGDFMAEMQTMVMASHPNIVTLYGFCFDYDMKALVYEFMKNGSLDKILFENHLSLEWGELYRLALGTAKGLAYLHDGCGKQIIHRDMKPANVLVAENLSAKITDFGLAKLICKNADHYTISQNRGTNGYMAPEFGILTSLITNKCDVYSFGVTLFEVLRKRRNDGRGEDWFPLQVWTKFKTGKLDELIESFGIPEIYKGKAKILSMVAFWCCQYTVKRRPSMRTVVDVLEKEIPVDTPPYPFEFSMPHLNFSMLPSQEVILDIQSEASTVVHESLAISNPTLVAAPDVFINAFDEVERKISSEIENLLRELETSRPQPFSLSDLESFTSNFCKKIGSGGYAVVYKGQFLDGTEVAVKVLHDIEVFDKVFMDVVMTLEMVKHPNIVKLHGYCFDSNMKALVYEYIENGSLDTILYGNHRLDIEWEQLYEIAIETAMGLSVLHAAGIIHHDIKASNILLDSNLSPKIRSYGLKGLIIMKRDDAATRITGSKCDVYSFGMLLFEVLGRRKVSNHYDPEWFPQQVWNMFDEGLLGQVTEDCGINKKDRKKAFNLSKVALWCAQDDPQKRPSMSRVVNMLEMKIPVTDPPRPFPKIQYECAAQGAIHFSGLEKPVMNPSKRFPKFVPLIARLPSIELSSVISNPTLFACRPQKFSRLDLIRYTSNFSEKIGNSGYGVVYKGKFPDGMEVAIKVLHDINETFMEEVKTMEMVYHPNIVELYGYCFDDQLKALVYEYIEKGSLDTILYRNHLHLEWKQLYEIATETAKGLSVLHALDIIHNNIKASNILLNSNLSPKIRSSGFGGHIILERKDDANRIVGSYGYSAPETWIPTSEVTSKNDVYSFGMLLFEVLGRRCISNHRGQEWFPAQVWKMFDKGLIGKVREDCGINKKEREKAFNLSKIALWCAQFDPHKRPSMSCVVDMLEMKIPVMDPPNPFPYAQLSSTSSSPEVSPRFKASPSIELRFHEERSLVKKSQSEVDWDNYMELRSRRRSFNKDCPCGGENSVVLYTTAGWHWQDRLTECNYVRSILKSHQVQIIERDISAKWDYWVELRKLLGRTEVPALFVHGKFIGGVNEVESLEEEGKLKLLMYALPVEKRWLYLVERNWYSSDESSRGLHFGKISRRKSI